MKLNIYKTIADILTILALFIIVPAYLLLPGKVPWYLFIPFALLVFAMIFFHLKAGKEAKYDERMVRVSGKSNMYALLVTTSCAIVLGLLAKLYEPEVLTVPVAATIIILTAVLSAKIIFEIMIRRPDAEGKK